MTQSNNFHSFKSTAGVGLVEIMIVLLLMSGLGLAATTYFRKNQSVLSTVDSSAQVENSSGITQKLLSSDLRQVAYLNPGCGGTPTSSTTACSVVKVRSGITPLPGFTKADVHLATNTLGLPENLTNSTSSLNNSSDGIRLVLYDFSTPINCRLNTYRNTNPSSTAGTATGAERFWPLRSGCNGNLTVGKLYLLAESIGGVLYSNVFQITALTDLGGASTSPDQLQVDAQSSSSIFNQSGGLALSGFSSAARIFPIKLVEWAVQPGEGLYRREIIPTQSSLNGYGQWNLVQADVEGIQFFPITATTTSIVEHERTMQFTSDSSNNGIEDIVGVSVRMVVKAQKPATDGTLYDNPLTAAVENDPYPRQEQKFFVDMQNAHTN